MGIALPLIGVLSTIAGGVQTFQAGRLEQKQLSLQADLVAAQAEKEELTRQEQLQRILASQFSASAATGFSPFSGSFAAISRDTASISAQQSRSARVGSQLKQSQLRSQGKQARRAGLFGAVGAGIRAAGQAEESGLFGSS